MHSTIDHHRKHLSINSPHEWPLVLQTTRRDKPYHVTEVEQEDVYDLMLLHLHSVLGKIEADQVDEDQVYQSHKRP